jgi:deoxyribonuclease V
MPGLNDFTERPFHLSREELINVQLQLGQASPEPWRIGDGMRSVAGCFICYPKGNEGQGAAGDLCWAAAALIRDGRPGAVEVVGGRVPAAYEPGLLALREGPLLETAVRRLPDPPDVLLVNATGRDHPRRAGLALHLGARLSLPTVGVTRNPLLAEGLWPAEERGASSPLRIGEEEVGCWLCTKRGAPPLAVHAAWRTSPETAAAVVMAVTGRWRTPEPLRQARSAARIARAASTSTMP